MFVMKGILFGMASSTVCYLMFLANVGLGNLRTHDPSDETEDERVQTATKWPHTYIFQMPALSGILPSRNSAPQRRPNHYIQRPYYVGEACIRALGGIQKKKDHGFCRLCMGNGPIRIPIDSLMVAIRQLSIGCRHITPLHAKLMADPFWTSGFAIFI